jgi:16S rRNA (cytosine967-C5)-methyltransferase
MVLINRQYGRIRDHARFFRIKMSDHADETGSGAKKSAKPVRRNDPNAPGLAARRVATQVLTDVLVRHLALDETLDKQIAQADIPLRDTGLVRAIATSAVRHLGQLRHAVQARLSGDRLPAKVPELEALLLIGAAQLLHLDVPDHAAVDMTMRVARDNPRLLPYAKLVNAVLRRIAREKEQAATDLGAFINLPDWISRRWIEHYGAEKAALIAQACSQEAALDLSVKDNPALWAQTLGAVLLPCGSLRLQDRRPVTSLPGYQEGAFWVQDAAASLPACLLAPQSGERIADLCAAPGGKTAQLALSGAKIVAVDRSPARLKRLEDNLKRLGLAAETLACDATTLETEPFDAILLDAPCSATGTLRRHPDVAWIKQESDIFKLAQLQSRLLDQAIHLLKPGGRLIYCTCSLEPEEGEMQIQKALDRHPALMRDPIRPEEIGGLSQALTPLGEARLLPFLTFDGENALSGVDGFFIARLRLRK